VPPAELARDDVALYLARAFVEDHLRIAEQLLDGILGADLQTAARPLDEKRADSLRAGIGVGLREHGRRCAPTGNDLPLGDVEREVANRPLLRREVEMHRA